MAICEDSIPQEDHIAVGSWVSTKSKGDMSPTINYWNNQFQVVTEY